MTHEVDSHSLIHVIVKYLHYLHIIYIYKQFCFKLAILALTFNPSKSEGLLDISCIMNIKVIPAIKVMSVSWLLSKYASILLRLVSAWCSEQKHSSWPARLDKLYSLPPFLELAIPWSEWLQFHTTRELLNIQVQNRIREWELVIWSYRHVLEAIQIKMLAKTIPTL